MKANTRRASLRQCTRRAATSGDHEQAGASARRTGTGKLHYEAAVNYSLVFELRTRLVGGRTGTRLVGVRQHAPVQTPIRALKAEPAADGAQLPMGSLAAAGGGDFLRLGGDVSARERELQLNRFIMVTL